MPTIVHYEVYVQEQQRGWVLQARYPGDERAAAIEDAKALELDMRLPVRVLKETYSTDGNAGTESLVYSGRFKPRPGGGPKRAGGGIETAGATHAAPFSQSDIESIYNDKRARGTADFMFRVMLVMVGSLVLAVMGTGLVSTLMSRTGTAFGGAQPLFMFIIFMALFLLTAVPLVMKYLPLDQMDRHRDKGPRLSFWSLFPTLIGPGMRQPSDAADEPASAAPTPATPPAPAADEAKPKAEDKAPIQPEATPAPSEEPPPTQDQAAADAAAPAEQATEEPQEPVRAEDPQFEKTRLVAMKFLGGAVNAIKATHPQLDAYNKFGVNLYLAGACDALGKHRGLDDARQADLVREAVEVIGTRPDQARQLVERLAGYRKEARYHQMIAAGFAAMEVYLSGHSDPFIAIGGVMKDWNTPQSRQVASNAVTLVFTDMVGSTDITHAIGDMAAQDIIRAHNHIVRTALSHFGGREVKHTGDGIMASFDEPEDAVRAALEIQQRAAQHTARWPKLPLHLRIGMNTGEPIIEENDYFGATVQVAARVCAAAGTGQVWISQATRNLVPASAKLQFRDHGPHSLKGVTEEITLYEVLWDEEAADTSSAPAQPAAPPTPAGPAQAAAPKAAAPKAAAPLPSAPPPSAPKPAAAKPVPGKVS